MRQQRIDLQAEDGIVRLDTLFRAVGDNLFARTDPQNALFL